MNPILQSHVLPWRCFLQSKGILDFPQIQTHAWLEFFKLDEKELWPHKISKHEMIWPLVLFQEE